MGRQVVHFAMGMTGISGLLQLMALCLPLHTVHFYSAGIIAAGKLQIYTFFAQGHFADNDLCAIIRKFGKEITLCEEIAGSHSIMDIQQRFCASLIDKLFLNSCTGFTYAYGLGMGMIILVVINLFLQGIATWMIYYYMYTAPKKKYREVALILVIVGTALVFMMLICYLPMVSFNLDSIQVQLGISAVIDTGRGTGISSGYMIFWVAMMVQVVQIILYKKSKIKEEQRLVELKMQEEFEAELAVAGQGGFDPYNQGGAAPYSQGGYGGDPYAQQSFPGSQQAGYPGSPQNQWGGPPGPGPPMPMPQPGYGGQMPPAPAYGGNYY